MSSERSDPARVLTDLDGWLDEQIADAVGTREEVEEDFPNGRFPNDADLAYAREKALREVRDRLASTGTTTSQGENDE